MLRKIEAVLFDIGGVVVNDHALRERALKLLSITNYDAFWSALNEAALPACRGEEPFAHAWSRIEKLLGIEIPKAVSESLWNVDYEAHISIDNEVLAIADELRGKVKTGIVSNTIDEHARVLRRLGVYAHFDELILSHEVGMTKDGASIFDLALERLRLPANSVVFIDDVERFRGVAATQGMVGILFQNADALRMELRRLGLPLKS